MPHLHGVTVNHWCHCLVLAPISKTLISQTDVIFLIIPTFWSHFSVHTIKGLAAQMLGWHGLSTNLGLKSWIFGHLLSQVCLYFLTWKQRYNQVIREWWELNEMAQVGRCLTWVGPSTKTCWVSVVSAKQHDNCDIK